MLYWDAFIQQENTTGCCIACSYKHFDSKINKLPIHYHKDRSHASEYGAFDKIKYNFLNDLSPNGRSDWVVSSAVKHLVFVTPSLSELAHKKHLHAFMLFSNFLKTVLLFLCQIYTVSLKKYCKHLKQNWVVMAPIFSLRHLLGEISLFLAANQTVSIVVFLELWSENCLMKVWL